MLHKTFLKILLLIYKRILIYISEIFNDTLEIIPKNILLLLVKECVIQIISI